MKLTAICPTYGRVPDDTFMLEEAIYWFMRQDYDDKELIILNDAKEQELVCLTPNVYCLNLSNRFDTLGDKYNYLCQIADGDVIVPWEDDDISLPGRLTQIANHLKGQYEYWKPGGAFFQSGQDNLTLCSPGNVFHNASGYKKTYAKRHPYPSVSGPQDAMFDAKALQLARFNSLRLALPSEFQYVYRWQHGSGKQPNLSGHSDTDAAYRNRPTPVAGTYNIYPRMYRNYAQLAKEYK